MAEALVVVTTVAGMDDARRLAHAVVERRLAACAQLAPIESVYRWQGELRQEPEVRIDFKTSAAAWPALERALVELHPYELPEIVALRPHAVHAPYARWLAEQTEDTR